MDEDGEYPLSRTSDNAAMRMLTEMGGAVVDWVPAVGTALDLILAKHRHRRAFEFFEDLRYEQILLTEDLVRSDDFLHAFVGAAEAAIRTERAEKVRLFAHLVLGKADSTINSVGEFDEMCALLDDLSPRELRALALIERTELVNPVEPEDKSGTPVDRYWDALMDDLARDLSIPSDHVQPMLQRLERSGLYFTLRDLWDGNSKGWGRLSPTWPQFRRAIERQYRRMWPFV